MTDIWPDFTCSLNVLPNLLIHLLIIQSISKSLSQLISTPECPLFALTNDIKMNKRKRHSVKSVQIRSFFWSVFSCIWTEYGDLLINLRIQSEYRKIRTRNNSVFGHFSCRDAFRVPEGTFFPTLNHWCYLVAGKCTL